MAKVDDPLVTRLRALHRNVRLVIYRTSTPAAGADFFVQRMGGPDGESVNGIEITELRVRFTIDRDLSKHPSRCEIEVFNLAPSTRAAVETKPLGLELSAGHNGVNRLLFVGDVLFALSEQKGPNWITKIQVGDASRAYARARVSRSYRGGTSIKTALRDLAKTMGARLPRNIEQSQELEQQCASGFVLSGPTRDAMTEMLGPRGYGWSFQNGQLQILRDEDSRNDIWPLSEDAGMILTPEAGHPPRSGKPPPVSVKSLLYPE
ncbi:MAG: hypothetical protein ACTHU0_01035, partial [Kofleriaceae bacterium]